MEQFSGQFSETSTGLNKFGQHSSLAQTRRQKSATWSDVRTILATALYVLPLYLETKKEKWWRDHTLTQIYSVQWIPKRPVHFLKTKQVVCGFSVICFRCSLWVHKNIFKKCPAPWAMYVATRPKQDSTIKIPSWRILTGVYVIEHPSRMLLESR